MLVRGERGNKAGTNKIGEDRRWSGSWPAIGLEMAVMKSLKRLPQQNNESNFSITHTTSLDLSLVDSRKIVQSKHVNLPIRKARGYLTRKTIHRFSILQPARDNSTFPTSRQES